MWNIIVSLLIISVFGIIWMILYVMRHSASFYVRMSDDQLYQKYDSKYATESVLNISSFQPLLHRNPDEPNDNTLYADRYTVSNPICKILFPSSMMFLQHHKTGTVLARSMRTIINDYCGIYHIGKIQRDYHQFLVWMSFRDSPQSLIKLQGNIDDNIKIHFWRDPVLTIVSGFTYHMTCNEMWASKRLSLYKLSLAAAFFNFNKDINILYQIYLNTTWTYNVDKEPPIWRIRMNDNQIIAMQQWFDKTFIKWAGVRVAYLYYLNDIVNQINLKNYGDFYGFNIDFNDTEIHRKYNIFRGDDKTRASNFGRYDSIIGWYSTIFASDEMIKYGLYFEMIRYLFAVYPEIYHYHFNMITDPKNELKMEVWNANFDRNVDVILDRLNLIDTVENKNKLKRYGLSNIDIAAERETLQKHLKRQDVSRVIPRDNGIEALYKKKNINTKRMYSKRHRINHAKMIEIMRGRLDRNENKTNEDVQKHHGVTKGKFHHKRRLKKYRINSAHIHTGRNDTKYIHALLTLDMKICLLLKHITSVIQYGWVYSEYC